VVCSRPRRRGRMRRRASSAPEARMLVCSISRVMLTSLSLEGVEDRRGTPELAHPPRSPWLSMPSMVTRTHRQRLDDRRANLWVARPARSPWPSMALHGES
jgi:hypothetical protein